MKDWKIVKGYVPILRHACDNDFRHHPCTGFGCWCDTDKQGRWYCPGCHALAPEEIQFCADLARCDPLIGNSYLSDDTDWYLQGSKR